VSGQAGAVIADDRLTALLEQREAQHQLATPSLHRTLLLVGRTGVTGGTGQIYAMT
jgi:hypothetical protein